MRSVILDTETTGLTDLDQIIEFAAVEIIDRRIGGHIVFRCKPTCRIGPGAEAVHGIGIQELANEPAFADMLQNVVGFCLGADEVVAHNADFDMKVLDREFRRAEVVPFSTRFKVVDTLKLAREAYPGQRNGLKYLAKRLEVEYDDEQGHGALYDATVLARCYLAMTSGQETMDLVQPVRRLESALPAKDKIRRIVFLSTPEELALHKAFCEANKIIVF
jgi:DNA polymerase-3 subunit epsilon